MLVQADQHSFRIKRLAAAPHFDMQVRSARLAGGAGHADQLAGGDDIARSHLPALEMGVKRGKPIGVGDQDRLAILCAAGVQIRRTDDRAVRAGQHRRARFCHAVDAAMSVRSQRRDDAKKT